MDKTINEILAQYKAGEITAEEANAALKEAGANFSLDPSKNPSGGWTAAEMAEGFRPGKPVKVLSDKPDMGRKTELAGMTVRQKTRHGLFAVTYDEDGYAVRASKMEG